MIKKFFFPDVLKERFLFLIYKTNVFIKLLKLMLIFIYWGFPIFLFLSGVIVFVFNCKHLLIILLRLEFIVLSLFMIIVIYLRLYNYEIFFRILYLTFCVCEGALGLSILVSIIRTHGNDYFNSFNVLQC
jgi:NADH-ubiquinone oxidoreductase chain 4L